LSLAREIDRRRDDREARDEIMGKYVLAWLLGVPLSVLAVIYLLSHAACG
jgi:hypothetical protein